MARSIHETRRDLRRIEESDFALTERRETDLFRVRARLEQKRSLKAAVRRERRRRGSQGVTIADTVPIVVTETGEYVHHMASVDDVRHFLRRLPRGVVDGLACVELQLATREAIEHDRREGFPDDTGDPFCGRPGIESFPGVYSPMVLGTYSPESAVVRLNAYVFHPATPLREIWEVLVRTRALGILAHEVGHHYDHTMRVRRGRWLAEEIERVEIYAEERQHVWLREIIIPHLRSTERVAIERLERWVAHFGGVVLPFELLVDDPRGRCKGGYVNLNVVVWPMWEALNHLADNVVTRRPVLDCRTAFARDLHYREMYDEALASLDTVLGIAPNHRDALTLRGDILVHLERPAEALALARRVVGSHPDHRHAWEVLVDALTGLERWAEAVAAATRLIALCAEDRFRRRRALFRRATAAMRVGDLSMAGADLDAAVTDGIVARDRWYERLRAELAQRAAGGPAPETESR